MQNVRSLQAGRKKVNGRSLVKKEDRYGMIMELPPYHKPKWGALFRYVLGRTKETFVRVTKGRTI